MSRPVLFVIDDDAGVVRALGDDLGRRFGSDYQVERASSADAGLAALRCLAEQGHPVALLIAGHVLAEMPGVEFLARARHLHPAAKRVLLVDRDYSSCSPVVQAMTLGQADYHITKPWMVELDLYRQVSQFLAEWAKDREAGFDLFRVVGRPNHRGTNELREMLARFNVPFRFEDADSSPGRALLAGGSIPAARVPVMIRYDGLTMTEPTLREVIAAVGASTSCEVAECDVAIVGAGPAGLTAAVYAASEGLRTVVLEATVSGGQAGSSPMIRNYPGFPHGISGRDLTRQACEQAWMFGAHMVFARTTTGLSRRDGQHVVCLEDGQQVKARAVIAAPGIAWRRLGVSRLEKLVGSGVFYGSAGTEARAFADRDVFVVGAGNSAGQTALHLARYAHLVTIVVRGENLERSMSEYLIREIAATSNIVVRLRTEVTDAHGGGHLDGLTLGDKVSGTVARVPASALFILIGGEPRTRWLPASVQLRGGYVLTGNEVMRDAEGMSRWGCDRPPLPLETSLPGVFAVGDARYSSAKRVASAVGDGATAVRLVQEYLS